MADRLSTLDTSFLVLEDSLTPLHVGSVMVFDPARHRVDHERLVALISERITTAPRYRQKVVGVPGNLANPVWVDDARFDVTYHVRRSALPKPGSDEQLEELVARIMPRPLDRSRPLWELYLVEGLVGGRFALITKTHHALVDGINAVDIAHVLLDGAARPGQRISPAVWEPKATPSAVDLTMEALTETLANPAAVVGAVKQGCSELSATAGKVWGALGGVVGTLVRASTQPAPSSPLNATVGRSRRFVMIGTDLAAHKEARAALGAAGEQASLHDVVLTVLTGAFRSWLLTRGETVAPDTTIRALVPVSLDSTDGAGGHELIGCSIDLPIGEPSAAMRLRQISHAMSRELDSGRPASASSLTDLAGFAAPTLHALGARLGSAVSRRLHNLVITNVPGPQRPRFAAGARLVSTFPVMPLQPGQALSIGLTSYDGGVFYGLYADREALPDLDVLGQAVVDSLAELRAAAPPSRRPRRS